MVDFAKYLKQESREQIKMRTGSVALADERIKEQQERAAQQAANKDKPKVQPVMLYFYDGLEILLRPLGDFNSCVIANKHYKYNTDRSKIINAICAKEIDPAQHCPLCEQAEEDRELTAKEFWYLPVWMYQATKTKDKNGYDQAPQIVTYTDNDVEKKACGIRILELNQYGAIGTVFAYIRKFMKDPANGKLTDRDFLISQEGKGKGNKRFVIDKKDRRPMDPGLARNIPTLERISEKLIEAMPPVLSIRDSGTWVDDDPSTSYAPSDNDGWGDLDDHPF